MVDRVEFRAPLGVLGRAVERLFLARYLEQLITRKGGSSPAVSKNPL